MSRYSVAGRVTGLFGAVRAAGSRAYEYDETAVIAIAADEYEAHGRLYQRAIDAGDLRKRTEAEWRSYVAEQKARAKAGAEAAAKEKTARAAAAAAPAPAEPDTQTTAPAEGANEEQPAAPAGGNPS